MKRFDEEKFENVSKAFDRFPNLSDRAVAKLTGSSPHTVGRYRAIKGLSTDNRVETSGRRARGRAPTFNYYEEQLPNDSATVYRVYSNNELLYVGCSLIFMQRLATHSKRPWWRDITQITTTHFDDRRDALIAERMAIRTEQPKYNIIGRTGRLLTEKMLTRARRTGAVSRNTPGVSQPIPQPLPPPLDGKPRIARPTGRVLV